MITSATPAAQSTDPPTATHAGLTASSLAPSTDHMTAPSAAPTAPPNCTPATPPALYTPNMSVEKNNKFGNI